MKAIRFIIPKTGNNSFRHQVDKGSTFYDNIHYHPEHQITLILKGEGTSFIGNHIERFQPGDIFMIGKNVPHVTRCDEVYYEPDSELNVHSISLFFKDESFGQQFFEIPEMAHIKRLLTEATKGLRLEGNDKTEVSQLIKDCQTQDGFERFQTFMNILNIFAQSKDCRSLSTISYHTPIKQADNERINIVFQYLSKNFKEDIELQEISEVANMTPNSFCRYFKQRTGKPYTVFLNEMRIEYAGNLIAGTTDSFGNIAAKCGYNSISYFNRQFKQITKLTPLQYRKKYN
ncbi:AraC family transcriptional regulator [Carboxylicivirga caseinilyticus]|uniref:AraC family transcriptional regulator n=1 Tax=Carboxylicivirga caseinilyticus TaxID=3417572 RepID=UPI003D33794D|nr:helix-turn-helix domain-containing protein [Marinilabiliaceae bacterium A049]